MVAVSNELVPSQKDCTAVSLIFCAIVYEEKNRQSSHADAVGVACKLTGKATVILVDSMARRRLIKHRVPTAI